MPRTPSTKKSRRIKIAAAAAGFVAPFLALWLMGPMIASLVTPGGGAAITRSVEYQPGERGTLDLYVPKAAGKAPVVVFFYGGRWQFGSKGMYGAVGKALASRGMIAIIPDYRLYPEVKFPDFLKDGAAAVRWAKDNAARLGGDPERIFVMGHSAGAHIAAMLALDPQWLAGAGLDAARDIAGLVGLSGPYDFLPLEDETLIEMFGGANRRETQPIAFVTPSAPPSFLATGADDTTVRPKNTSNLGAKLRENNVAAEERMYPGRGHVGIVLAFIGPLRFLAPVLDDVARFVQATPSRAG